MTDDSNQLSLRDHDTLIRVESKLESLTEEIRSVTSINGTALADHETRLRSLESANELDRGTNVGVMNHRRTLIEIVGIVAAIITAIGTYMLARH